MFWEGKPTGKHLHSTNGDIIIIIYICVFIMLYIKSYIYMLCYDLICIRLIRKVGGKQETNKTT
jgi:hypothetical protein